MRIMLGIFLLSFTSVVLSQSDEKNVLDDWVKIQETYPQTTEFKKIEENKYHIVNSGFYSGNIFVKNIIVEESEGYFKKTADIVVSLDVDEEQLYKEKGRSFSRWDETNRLVFDESKNKWVRYRDLSYKKPSTKKNCAKKKDQRSLWEQLLVATFPILIIILVFYMFLRSMNKGGKNINERLLDSNLEIAKELKRIADKLEKDS